LKAASILQPNHPEVSLLSARILGAGLLDKVRSRSVLDSYLEHFQNKITENDHSIDPEVISEVYNAIGQLYNITEAHSVARECFENAKRVLLAGVSTTSSPQSLDIDTRLLPKIAEL
jgi:hypothetical protein